MSSAKIPDLLPARIIEVVERSPRVVGLRVKAAADFSWTAGQHVALSGAPHGAALGYYSIASAPYKSDPGSFDLAAASDLLPEGVEPRAGADIWISPPAGAIVMERLKLAEEVVLVGIGTGVAPLRAMLQEFAVHRGPKTIILLQGARTAAELLFSDEFAKNSYAGFRYCPVVSRPSDDWKGLRGHVQDHLLTTSPAAQYCVCGSMTMVEDVTKVLRGRSISDDRIYAEGY